MPLLRTSVAHLVLGVAVAAALAIPAVGCSSVGPELDDGPSESNQTGAEVRYLDQGWDDARREQMYFSTEGSRLLPYAWFIALRVGDVDGPHFASASHLREMGYLAAPKSAANPDGLPVGFAPDGPSSDSWIGVTCTACHTGQMRYRGKEYRIDGGQTLANFSRFQKALFEELAGTRASRDRFQAFAEEVGGDASKLEEALDREIAKMKKRLGFAGDYMGYGPGRLDGIGQASNELICFSLEEPANCITWHAPSTPGFLWQLGELDFFQSNALTHSALARNVAQASGTFGVTDKSLETSVNLENLIVLEEGFAALKAPSWTDPAIDLPPLDGELVERGHAIYRAECQSCHASRSETSRTAANAFGQRFVPVPVTPLAEIGTDRAWIEDLVKDRAVVPDAFKAIFEATGATVGADGKTEAMRFRASITAAMTKALLVEAGIRPSTPEFARALAGRENKDPVDVLAYRAQPLEGIAFSAPFLHNGSVRTLAQLLLPGEERDTEFWAGSREFDPDDVGFVSDESDPNAVRFDTTKRGNSNRGHEYGTSLDAADRRALLEYLKSI